MNLFSLATDGVDLDALPLEQSQQPRASFRFSESSEPARLRLPRELDDVFSFAANEYGVDVDVLRGIAYAESRFNPDIISGKVKSPAGAIGLMQFMPETAQEYGIDPTDPVQAIMGGAAYLRKSLDKFDGDYERAVASYNWGPNRKAYDSEDWASKAPQETQKYLMTVFGAVGKFKDGAAEQPAASSEPTQATPLPAGVAPSTAGGGRGSVSPGMVNTKLTRTAVPDMTVGSVAQDIGSGLLQIGQTAVKGTGELARLATGDRLGKGITDFAERGMQATQDIVGSDRAAAQRQNLAADMADDSVSLGQAIANNKGALADQILPTLGSMAIPLGAAGVAGKAATVGRAAQGLSKAAMAARVASVQQAAGIGATAAQNAASTFAEMVDKGVSMPDAYKAAGITVPFSLIAGKLTGGGAEGALIKGLSGQSVARGAVELAKAPLREGAQEGGESLGQVAGEVLGAGQDVSLQSGIKRVGTEALLGAVVGGGMGAVQQIAAPRVESQPTTPQAPPAAPAAPVQNGTPPVAPTPPAAQGTADAIMELERRLQAAANPTAQQTSDAGTTPVAPTGNAGATEGAGGAVAAVADGQPEQAQSLSVPENFTATPTATVGAQTSVQAGPGFTGKGIAAEMAALRARSQPAPVAAQPATQQAEQPRTTKAAQPAKANLDPQGLLSDDERQMLGEFTRLYQTDLKADIRQRLGMTPKEQATVPMEKKKPSALLSLIVQMGGIKSGLSSDLTGANAMEGNRRYPGLFRNNGKQLDVLVQSLKERGYLTQADEDSILDNGGTNKLADMIQAELSGERAKLVDNTDGFEDMRDADMRQGMEDKATALGLSQDMVNSMSDARLNGTIKRIEARLGHPIKTDFATRKMSRAEARAEREAILMADRYERARAKYDAELQAFAEADDTIQDAALDVFTDEDGEIVIVRERDADAELAAQTLNGTWSDQNEQATATTRDTGTSQNQGEAGAPVTRGQNQGAEADQGDDTQAGAGEAQGLTVEQKIRQSFRTGSVSLGVAKPITITHNGVTRQFMARQDRLSNGRSDPTIHLNTVKRGRMLRGDPETWILDHYKLTGKNELVSDGLPQQISDDEASKFKDNFETEALTPYTPAEVTAKQEAADKAERTAKAKKQADDLSAKREQERKEIATASVRAADTFELGGNAEDNLTGQEGLRFSRKAKPNKDAEYLAAVERGDMDAAQKMVDQAALDAGYITANDYRMQHRAPNSDGDVNLVDLRESGLVPDDYWTAPIHWYQGTPEERESFYAVTTAMRRLDLARQNGKSGNSNGMYVYRAVPKDVKDGSIRNGDWVTPSRAYAALEGASIPEGYRIISQHVRLKNLYWDGNSMAEWGVDDGEGYAYKNTKNNRKLVDAVTYDDDGNVIPLSQRFNSRSDDVRRSFAGQGAGTADRFQLTNAQRMLGAKRDPEVVRRETGWFTGVDGKWRFEIADNEAAMINPPIYQSEENYFSMREKEQYGPRVSPSSMKAKEFKAYMAFRDQVRDEYIARNTTRELRDLLDHPKLFAAYPNLADIRVDFVREAAFKGAYYPQADRIKITLTGDQNAMLSTLLHEVQHAIQEREGFATGGASEESFAQAVKNALRDLRDKTDFEVDTWKASNLYKIEAAGKASDMARSALIYESAQRLIDYANKDNPSSVFRLIRNELQWIYGPEFKDVEGARELQYDFYNIPKSHRMKERNAFIGDMAFKGGQLLLKSINPQYLSAFKADERTTKGMVAALRRESDRKRRDLEPLHSLERTAANAQTVQAEHRYSSPFDVYKALAGEVEARNTQARQKMTDEQRKYASPLTTADVPAHKVVVMFGGLDIQAPMVSQDAPTGTPTSTIRQAITKAYGNLLTRLEGKGLVTLTQTEEEAIAAAAQARADKNGGDVEQIKQAMRASVLASEASDIDLKRSADGNLEGFFDPATGKSFLIADNLTAESAPGTLMHEVGIHMAADGKLEPLFNRAAQLLKLNENSPFIQRVQARMDQSGETSNEEAAAYIVTEYENDRANAPASVAQWVKDFIADVRAWLFGRGVLLKADQLTVADIAAVARANAKSMAVGDSQGDVRNSKAPNVYEWADRESAPVGAWVKVDYKLADSQPVYQVREMAIDDLYLPELNERGQLQPEKRRYLDSYTERAKSGEKPPAITVIEMESGRMRVVDGHRRVVAAKAAEQASIRALVSPLVDTADGRVEATAENIKNSKQSTPDKRESQIESTDIRRSISRAQQPLFNQTPAHTWEELGESYVDKQLYDWQDDRIDLKRVQESITKAGRQIVDQFDARTAETLLPGRLAKRTEDFMAVEAAPLLKDMAKNNVTMEEVSDYMLARHAPERNAQIAKVNPDMPDNGSGTNSEGVLMTTQAANDHIAALTTGKRMVLEMLARRVDAITKGTRDLLVAEGLEKAETIRAWEGAYKHYVPLFRDEAANTPGHPIGSGISVTGSASKRATGSEKEVTNMLAHVLMQREAAITRAEKNRVDMSLYGMALSHPNKAFWSTVQPNMKTADIVAELQRMGVDPMDGIMGMDAAPTIRTVDDRTGLVVDRPNPMYKKLDNAIVVKVNGEDRVILFNTKNERAMRMAGSLKNQHFDQGMWVDAANTVAPVTRFMASMMTQYNPAFGMVNAVRDIQGALMNLTSTPLNGKQARVLADTPAAVIGIARDIRGDGKRTPWSDLWVQFQEDGGRTGYRDLVVSPYERAANMEKDIKRMQQEGKWTPGNAAHAVLDLLGDFNDSLENGVRLAAYKAALDKGMTRAQAAKLARELTVDFNRKGRKGRELGKLYAFLNASIQGNARNIATVMGAHGGKVLAGGFALGVLQALMLAAAGYEDDEIREFQKARGLIIPIGGKQHITIPLALGFHVIPNTSRILTELMLTGGKDWQTKVPEAMFEIANAANPFGGGGDWKTAHGPLTMVMPTAGDWAVDLAMNRDFTGNQISRTRYNERNPGSAIARESTLRTPSGQVYQGISKAINDLTGGSDRKAGAVSPTPEELRYIMGVVGGGVYRETEKAINAAVMLASGDEIKATQVPLGSRFVGEVRDEDVQRSRYYKNSRKLEDLEADLKDAAKDRDSAKMNELRQDKLTNAIGLNNAVQRHITQINKMAKDDIGDKAAMAKHDANRAAAMRRLNDEVLKLEKQAQ